MTIHAAASLADVARRAGVSLSTASRALNNAYGVSVGTRARVLESAHALDFVVSPDARRLATGTTGRVALVVPHLDRWFFGQITSGIERVLSQANLDVLLYHVDDEQHRREFLTKLPARRKVDAVVIVAFPVTEEDQTRLEKIGAKIVAAGSRSNAYPSVGIDDYAAGRLAMDHLLSLGHTRIAMIALRNPDQPDWSTDRDRAQAYRDALNEHGLPMDPDLVREVELVPADAAEAIGDILDTAAEPPTAVYTHADELAFGVLRILRNRGHRVPEDISVIGIDDHPMAELLDLTTIAQDVRAQGATAGRLVLQALGLEPADPGIATTYPISLILRSSTGRARTTAL
ncbi:LacI family DNA-binding transcriptional regulator [Arthrobacter bambusae]|uniref:LacI family DNA-binding transcriptional regulator n=1 Tax=Arthrobacter bambusae TaxID=1338426 RepID=UPI0027856B84|nr:LacI family DNA-binding transcriptional regulator [Arthrobacter bambusae]MDQ0031678.1 DNA-binding LacI/PurR family transcriptional regulator [Arthrobacter bambusae]MDQ0098781.1 DNA-binding LacI/PurR family transcriptional regulator [Arthrobacter bambusae]